MKQLTIELTNKEYQRLEYYLNEKYGAKGKMENKARVVLLQFVVDESQKDLDESMAALMAEDGQHGQGK